VGGTETPALKPAPHLSPREAVDSSTTDTNPPTNGFVCSVPTHAHVRIKATHGSVLEAELLAVRSSYFGSGIDALYLVDDC